MLRRIQIQTAFVVHRVFRPQIWIADICWIVIVQIGIVRQPESAIDRSAQLGLRRRPEAPTDGRHGYAVYRAAIAVKFLALSRGQRKSPPESYVQAPVQRSLPT